MSTVDDTQLEHYVNAANWPSDVEAAREFAREAINRWAFKEKAPKFLAQIDKASTVKRLQEIVIYPLLSGEGLGVVR